MGDVADLHLSRRESQVLDLLYTRGELTVAEVLAQLPDPPATPLFVPC